jgi:hypothetical protein
LSQLAQIANSKTALPEGTLRCLVQLPQAIDAGNVLFEPEFRSRPVGGCDAPSQKGAGDAPVARWQCVLSSDWKNATMASLSPSGDEASPLLATDNFGIRVEQFECISVWTVSFRVEFIQAASVAGNVISIRGCRHFEAFEQGTERLFCAAQHPAERPYGKSNRPGKKGASEMDAGAGKLFSKRAIGGENFATFKKGRTDGLPGEKWPPMNKATGH